MKKGTAFLSLALLIAAPASAREKSAVPPNPAVSTPLFGRILSFRLPAQMVLTTDKRNDTHVLMEYIPKGQTVANWTRMVTIQAYRGLGASTRTSADIAKSAFFPAACVKGPIYRNQGEKVMTKNLKRSIIVNGCASLPVGAYPKVMAGAGEQDFIMMFRDADTIYALNYAVRGAPFHGKSPPVDITTAEEILEREFGTVNLFVPAANAKRR
jgi:hypothetical protein